MMEIVKLQASRPINVEAKAVAEKKVVDDMNIYASEQKQTLAEAADEIQKLLKQLEQTNPDPITRATTSLCGCSHFSNFKRNVHRCVTSWK